MKNILLIIAFLVEPDVGFVIKSTHRFKSTMAISSTIPRLSDIDLMALENVAEFCLSADRLVEECDLDEHLALVNQLTVQRNILLEQRDIVDDHVRYLDDVLARLLGHEIGGHSLDESESMYGQ
ncbi:hypothetical protein IV203_003253 [Nitzschia inconspicua]|uniref:Uncharacterized protein n=1 Tax=Nitzschia inconspicua TaxID=303405 RepID=A0A9K3L2Z3_9STRA|nr:hypothetical protein IV203_003253 [Nitzschia inconspicua]